MTAAPALELRSVEKRFGTVAALVGASMTAAAGSLHMLLGENGAGKTTLLRIASGFLQPDVGEVLVSGIRVRWRSRANALRAGIAAVEQHFSLVPAMTVAENIALAAEGPFTRYSPRRAAERVERLASAVGLRVEPNALVGTLPVAAQQRTEILKALSTEASLLILDEPTAVLTPAESEELFGWIRTFVLSGKTAVVITHRVREALEHGDSLTVLRAGRTVMTANRGGLSRDELIAAIIGERGLAVPSLSTVQGSAAPTGVVASLEGVGVVDASGISRLRDVTLEVRQGEIVGVAGVEGSGQRELLRVLAGRTRPTSGTASLPARAGFIPEDRLRDALVGEMTLTENMGIRGLGGRAGVIDWTAMAAGARAAIARFAVHASDEQQPAVTLSGGNQQRFVLARELADGPPLIVAENPARGLDVRASVDVMSRLAAARNAGAAVVLYSSDLDDLIGFVDRMLVCFDGTVREVASEFSAVGDAMLGIS